MLSDPKLVDRPELHYAGITTTVSVAEISDTLPPLVGEITSWLAAHGIEQTNAPLFRYDVIDMPEALTVTVGVPVAEPFTGDGHVEPGALPAGRYVVATHVGPYEELEW